MPVKRTSSSEPTKRPAPRKRRASVSRSASVAPQLRQKFVPRASYLLSPDEKREMILAHAAMRRTTDPTQMMTLWAGVAATFLVVVGAWGWAYAPGLVRAFQHGDPELQQIVSNAQAAQREATGITADNDVLRELNATNARLDVIANDANVKSQALDGIAAAFNSSSTTPESIRSPLFQATSSSTNTNKPSNP